MVGLGSVGRRHLRNLRQLGVTAIDAYRTRPAEGLDGEPVTVYSDLDAALANHPTAIVIANPTSLHLPVALRAAVAGCHLFIEKPLSHSLDGLDELVAVVRERNLVALPGYTLRFHPGLLEARQLLSSGRIGRLLSIRAEVGQYLPDWRPGEDYRRGYSARRNLGGGALLDLCHELDYVMWLAGPVTRVGCVAEHVSDLEIETEDVAEVILRFASGAVGAVHLDYLERSGHRSCRLIGSGGTIVVELLAGEVRCFDVSTGTWDTRRYGAFARNDMFLAEMEHFLACVQGRETPRITLDEGVRVQRLIAAANHSAREGRFVDHPLDAMMLT